MIMYLKRTVKYQMTSKHRD